MNTLSSRFSVISTPMATPYGASDAPGNVYYIHIKILEPRANRNTVVQLFVPD